MGGKSQFSFSFRSVLGFVTMRRLAIGDIFKSSSDTLSVREQP